MTDHPRTREAKEAQYRAACNATLKLAQARALTNEALDSVDALGDQVCKRQVIFSLDAMTLALGLLAGTAGDAWGAARPRTPKESAT